MAAALLGTTAAIYGGVSGSEVLLAMGLVVGFISLLLLPVLRQQVTKRRRLADGRDALLVWTYTDSETAGIARREAVKMRKYSFRLSLLFFVCLALMTAIFAEVVQSAEAKRLVLILGAVAAVMPFVSLLLAPAYTTACIRKSPSRTVIGSSYIQVNNRYLGINDRADLKLKTAGVGTTADGAAALVLVYTFKAKYGGRIPYTLYVPIPQDKIEEARLFAKTKQPTTSQ